MTLLEYVIIGFVLSLRYDAYECMRTEGRVKVCHRRGASAVTFKEPAKRLVDSPISRVTTAALRVARVSTTDSDQHEQRQQRSYRTVAIRSGVCFSADPRSREIAIRVIKARSHAREFNPCPIRLARRKSRGAALPSTTFDTRLNGEAAPCPAMSRPVA